MKGIAALKTENAPPAAAPINGAMLQRKCACGAAPGVSGECAECQENYLQRKLAFGTPSNLAISEPRDAAEREADRIADAVVSGDVITMNPAEKKKSGSRHDKHHAEAARIEAEQMPLRPQKNDEETLSRKVSTPEAPVGAVPPVVNQVLHASGEPLDSASRNFFSARLGHDFSRVRVHTDTRAAESARAVNALAYTVGHNIVFRSGFFAPATKEGRRLLAHELTHVVQQRAAPSFGIRDSETSVSRNVRQPGLGAIMLQRQVEDPRKLQIVSEDSPRRVRVSEWLVERVAGDVKQRTEIYWVDFRVDRRGVVTASVRTVSPDRAYRSSVLRFGEEFRRALAHFRENGTEVTAFEGDWSYMSRDEISENLRSFRESLAQGGSREGAARSTPTGRVAASVGFDVVSVENVPESQEHLAEEGVRRWRVRAVFRPVPPPASGGTGESANKPPVTPTSGAGPKTETAPPAPKPERATTASKGVQIEAGHASVGGSVKGRATEFGAQAILAKQVQNARGAEAAKAVAALEKLGPEIEKLREAGNGVVVTLVMEVPNQVDIAAVWAGVGDPGQVVYFKKMYISQVLPAKKSTSTQTTISENLAPGDPDQQDPHSWTLDQQIRNQTRQKYPVRGTEPRKGFHFVSRELYLPSYTGNEKSVPQTREAPNQLKGIAGTYRLKFESLFVGNASIIPSLMTRGLQVEQDSSGKLVPKMWRGSTPYSYERYAVRGAIVMNGRFALGEGRPPAAEWIWSGMEYPREGLILEWAKGLDSGLNIVWDALFSWHKT